MTVPSFPDHLIDAVTAAGAGLHFEEGGCFAMALALTEKLRELGAAATPALMTGVDHAVVCMDEVPGLWLDHMGYDDRKIEVQLTDEAGLREMAGRCGWSPDEFEADLSWAREIVEIAVELERDAKHLPSAELSSSMQ